jgi:hypothetical protein
MVERNNNDDEHDDNNNEDLTRRPCTEKKTTKQKTTKHNGITSPAMTLGALKLPAEVGLQMNAEFFRPVIFVATQFTDLLLLPVHHGMLVQVRLQLELAVAARVVANPRLLQRVNSPHMILCQKKKKINVLYFLYLFDCQLLKLKLHKDSEIFFPRPPTHTNTQK